MSGTYEQMALDTRPLLEAAIADLAEEFISRVGETIQEHHRQVALEKMISPPHVRNRHEAYGIAAEQLAKITGAVKSIKNDTDSLLGTLADPNLPALEATSSICNSTAKAAYVLLTAAAEMRRTMNDLYTAENTGRDEASPMDEWAEAAFEEAEPAETGENELEE